MCTRYPIINRVSELKVHIELTRFVQPEKIEIDANERAVNEKSQYCFFVCTTFDSFLNDFNRVQFEAVRSEAGLNRFVMTPTKWIEQTNAIGIVSKAGRYGGGTYAHSDIAMAFATWISPEFQLYS